ncbi:hypothetical protein SUDANB178_01184 [Streptomyces sp. enrichment culture]
MAAVIPLPVAHSSMTSHAVSTPRSAATAPPGPCGHGRVGHRHPYARHQPLTVHPAHGHRRAAQKR